MLSLQQNIESEAFARIVLDLSYNFLLLKNLLKSLFDFHSTALVLAFVFVFIRMLDTRLPSQFTLLSCYEKKSKGNFSALIAVLSNSSVISIITCTAVWQHLDDSFSALGYHVAWTPETASGNDFSPRHQHYFWNVKQLLFFL